MIYGYLFFVLGTAVSLPALTDMYMDMIRNNDITVICGSTNDDTAVVGAYLIENCPSLTVSHSNTRSICA